MGSRRERNAFAVGFGRRQPCAEQLPMEDGDDVALASSWSHGVCVPWVAFIPTASFARHGESPADHNQ